MQLPNKIITNKNVFLGVDWSRNQIDVFDGKNWSKFSSLMEVAENFPNSVVFLEASAESFELQKRKEVLEAFAKNNVDAYCFPTRWTASYRKENSIHEKTNPTDAKVIREIGITWPKSLCKFKEITNDPLGKKINEFLIYDRYAFDSDNTKKLAEEYIKDYSSEFVEFLKTGKKYRAQVGRFVATALEVRKAGKGFREFRRQIGNYAQGYGRMTRSEFYWWWTRTITKTRLKRLGEIVKKNDKKTWWNRMTIKQQQIHRQVLKVADKVLKYIWQCTAVVK